MMRVPEGQFTVTVNNGLTGERHVQTAGPNTVLSDILERLGVNVTDGKSIIRLRLGTPVTNSPAMSEPMQEGHVITVSPSKQDAGLPRR